MNHDHRITSDYYGNRFVLDPEGAIWWEAEKALLLSDVHLGKSGTFRAFGLPVPAGDDHHDLQRIEHLVQQFEATRLFILGDFVHSKTHGLPEVFGEISRWLGQLDCQVILARGNHDPRIQELETIEELKVVDQLEIQNLLLIHRPEDAPENQATVCGHLHPTCAIGPKRSGNRRVKCFLRSETRFVLPAFGTFTSGNKIDPDFGATTAHPIAGNRVYTLNLS